MQIKRIDGFVALCEAKGVTRSVGLTLLQHEELAPGDFVVVHLGHAVEKVSAEQASRAWALYDEMIERAAAMEQPPPFTD